MIKILIILSLFCSNIFAKNITPDEIYLQVRLIQEQVHNLHKHFGIKHHHEDDEEYQIKTKLKPRISWQKTYEIMVKINILRNINNLSIVEPVGISPLLNLPAELTYEMTERILTELKILHIRLGIKNLAKPIEIIKGKTSLDVFNGLNHVSESLDELNQVGLTPSYVFGENMRIYDDLTIILQHLNIKDTTIPPKQNSNSTVLDTFNVGMEMLLKIKQIQIKSGIAFVDFSEFRKEKVSPSDVFTITGMVIAELQTIKAYIGLTDDITSAAAKYHSKTPAEVDQLMRWNVRKLSLINNLDRSLK